MKITENVVTDTAVHRLIGRLCQTPRRFTETPYNRVGRALFGICMLLLCATAFAQNADSIADREVQRRQAGIPAGEAAPARGKTPFRSRDYSVGEQEIKKGIASLPAAAGFGGADAQASGSGF